MSIPSELGHLAMPTNFLAQGKTRWHKRVPNPGPLDPEFYALPLHHTGSAGFLPTGMKNLLASDESDDISSFFPAIGDYLATSVIFPRSIVLTKCCTRTYGS